MGLVTKVSAQTPISLPAAIDSSLKNNLSLRSEQLKVKYQKQLAKSAFNLPGTDVYMENGQINSVYIDQRFGVSQTMNFPTVYKRNMAYFNEQTQLASSSLQVSELDLKQQVRQCFYQIIYLDEKESLLKRNDSFLSKFLEKSTLKFKLGDINILEKTGAENQRNRIALQLQQLYFKVHLES
jgi:cobalt-zinc-cadmium resistance protein CzcA